MFFSFFKNWFRHFFGPDERAKALDAWAAKMLLLKPEAWTKHFKDFFEYREVEDKAKKAKHSYEHYLAQYIVETKKSPFLGDSNLKNARRFLRDQGISENILDNPVK